ncbi:hypothetical protein GCM10027615_38920 [Plantactinospora veratri]
MGCPHSERCPLFPLLNASLRSWRDYYCDTADGWQECARYRLSLTGAVVPIILLPNGVNAQHLKAAAAGVDRSRPAQPPRAHWSGFDPRQPVEEPTAFFEQAATRPQPATHPLFPHVAQSPGNTPWVPPQPRRRRWWTRFLDWISGPA